MNTSFSSSTSGATSRAPGHGNALAAIFWAGLLCGIFDIIAAFVLIGVGIHTFTVGLTIALTTRRMLLS